MTLFEYQVRELENQLSKDELAKALVTTRELAEMYKQDNDALRKENNSLKYLIAKYRIETVNEDVLNNARD